MIQVSNQQPPSSGAVTTEAPIKAEGLTRIYKVGSRRIKALDDVSLEIPAGEVVAVRGRSGSGKTTLLNCLSGLDEPTQGGVWLNGQYITRMNELGRIKIRRAKVGFIFQSHALMPNYSAAENVDLMLRLAGWGRSERLKRTREVIKQVGLIDWIDHRPFELSGGQQQRVSIARAIAPRPAVIFADEPTGELDVQKGAEILNLFRDLAETDGTTILVATHDLAVDNYADQVIYMQDGRIFDKA